MFKKFLYSLLFIGTLLHATPATQESLTKLYIATFDRVPDAEGLKYWLDSKWEIEDIAMSFFDQKETQAKYPEGFSQEDFIQAIYKNLFGRSADSDGFDYWLDALNGHKTVRPLFILAIMNGALGDDAKLLNNKVVVGLAFVRDGRSDIAEAHTILYAITHDRATINPTLCQHTLAGCKQEKQEEADTSSTDETTSSGGGSTSGGGSAPVNHAPSITSTAPTTATEDTAYSYNPTATDPENGTISWTLSDAPASMSINASTGAISWTPTEGVTTSSEVTLTATDDGTPNQSTTEKFTIAVTAVNDAPSITSTAITTATEDTAYSYTPTATDPENGTISWTLSDAPASMSINASTGAISWTPTEGVSSSGEVTLTATDDGTPNQSTTEKFTIAVTAVNDTPTANGQNITMDEDTAKSITLTGSDPEGSTLTYAIVATPSHGSLTGTAPAVTYTPTANYAGDDSFTFKVNDGTVDSTVATVSIIVTDINEKPIANAGADQTDVAAGEIVSLDGSGSTDADSGDTLTYLWAFTTKPTESTATLDNNTSDKPSFTSDKVGTYALSLTVNDGTENSDADSVTITTIDASTLSSLKKTGQTTSYDTNQKDDGAYQIGVAHSYTHNGDDTVTDNVTGLIWQDNDAVNNTDNKKNWADAKSYCEGLSFAGFSDWRLPTIDELVYITDKGKSNPAINSAFLHVDTSSDYWSSTTYASSTSDAWVVYFNYGNGGYSGKDYSFFVRCVRAGQ